ncbi:MAG: MaoC/PaaZ C-terminal domain-containing protein [Burkholderiales bacterium]|jgi:acyl dehydratase
MALDRTALTAAPIADVVQRYDARDAILYALGLGLGDDPTDPRALRHLLESRLVVPSTFATVLGYPFMWFEDPRFGVDGTRLVHAGHALELHAPLPPAATVRGVTRATAIADKGPGRGAVLVLERTLTDEADGRPLATQTMTLMARGDGGFSERPGNGPAGGDAVAAPRAPLPQRAADATLELRTLPQQALLYRLVADPNPLHADPEVARAAGFERPILHGLSAYGMAGRAVATVFGDGDLGRIAGLSLRFAAPVFPGDTLRMALWDDAGTIRFRASVPGRGDVVVLDQGEARLA